MDARYATPIGESLQRSGGRERVSGALRYTADIKLEGVLQVKLVHLPVGHARIISIDTTAARRVNGVVYIMTAADLPQPIPRFGPSFLDRPILASNEVKFHGEPVAAVVAEDEDAANEAVSLIEIKYEELRGIYSVESALQSEGLLVQKPELRGDSPWAQTNILQEWNYGWGTVEQNQADLILNQRYSFPMISHFAIEPFVFLAAPSGGGLTIWSPIQHPFVLQRVIAQVLNLPVPAVRVIAPDPGGGFGGKGYPKFEPLLAFLALKTSRPVRLVLDLEESCQASRRASCEVNIRSGFYADGHIAFQDIEANFLVGAYADISNRVVAKSSFSAAGPYHTPNARIVARSILSHTIPSTAFRGFGVPQLVWALESQIDEAAHHLNLDPLEIRLRNLAHKGDEFIPGDTPSDGDWEQSLRQTAQAINWGQPLAPHHGRGIALGVKSSATVSSSNVIARLHSDGSVSLVLGTSDMGQGARTVMTQIAAAELGIPSEAVHCIMGDTAVVPFDSSTSASRGTVFMGNAVSLACKNIRQRLQEIAVEIYEISTDKIDISEGKVNFPGSSLPYKTVMKDYFGPGGGELIGVGSAVARYQPRHPLGGSPAFWEFVAVGCEIMVDEMTGEITLHKLVTTSDVGMAINPQHVEMQDEGAAVMGIGHTLMEHLILDSHGCVTNLGALDYRIPTARDIPLQIESYLIENHDGPGPYGAKGVGESGILAISPAVAEAVREATGLRIHDLPLTPERVWRALQVRDMTPPSL